MSGAAAIPVSAAPNAPPLEPGATPEATLAPVVDVGGRKGAAPGQPGSNLIQVYQGAGNTPTVAPGDDKIQHDFLAGRALAQAGDPWSKLDALVGGAQPSQGAP